MHFMCVFLFFVLCPFQFVFFSFIKLYNVLIMSCVAITLISLCSSGHGRLNSTLVDVFFFFILYYYFLFNLGLDHA